MKKKMILVMAVFGMIALTSCKKQYTCYCSGNNGMVDYEGTIQIEATPSKADETCKAQEGTTYGGVQTTCVIQE